MGASFLIFCLGLAISKVQCYSSHSGEYTILNKGLVPLHYENEYMKYDATLAFNRTSQDRLLSANCTVFQKLGPVGIHVEFLKEDHSGQPWPAAIAPLKLDNVCDAGFDENAFLDKFKRVKKSKKSAINLEDCSIHIGDYLLTNWTIEPHIKKGLGKYFFYGDFVFDVKIFGKPDGETEVVYGSFHLKLSIVNKELEDHRRQHNNGNNKNDKKGKKGKKEKKEKEGEEEEGESHDYQDYKDPEAWKDTFTP